jgi:hypothetical protein
MLIYNQLSYKYYIKTIIIILIIELINLFEIIINIQYLDILLMDGMIRINKLIISEEMIIYLIGIIILIFYQNNIKLKKSKIMV